MPERKTKRLALVPVTTAPVVRVIENVAPKKKKKRRRQKKKGGGMDIAITDYVNSMNNPFEVEPIPLGLGTMIPTECCNATFRTNFAANADGSFCCVLNPGLVRTGGGIAGGSFFQVNTAAFAAAATWTSFNNPTNQASLIADYDQLRILSAGIRVTPIQAATASPGILFSGVIAPSTNNVVPGSTAALALGSGTTTQQCQFFPAMKMTKGYDPIQVTWRPSELSDFDFDPFTATMGTPPTNVLPAIVIVGMAFPASVTVFIDIIAHYEGYASQLSASSEGGQSSVNAKSLGIPSVDSLWAKAVNYLNPSVNTLAELAIRYGKNYLGSHASGLFPNNKFALRNNRFNLVDLNTVDLVKPPSDEKSDSESTTQKVEVPPVKSRFF